MAEELELLLKVSKQDAETGLDQVTQQILELRKQQQQLDIMLKEGSVTQHQYAKSTAENKVQLSNLGAEQKRHIKVVQASSGSMLELRSALAQNKQEYQALSKEERENEEIGGKLLKTIQAQDAEHKRLSKSIGQNQVDVGNYTESIKDALSQSGFFGDQLGAVGGSLGFMAKGLNISITGLKSFRAALIRTGIGAFVIAIGAVTTYFTKTERGAQRLKIVMAGLGAFVDTFTDMVIRLGEYLVSLFEDPQESIKRFGDMIRDYVLGRIELLMKGLAGVGKSLQHLFKGEFKDAYREAIQSTKDIGRAVLPVVQILEGAAEVTKRLGKEFKEAGKQAIENAKIAMALQDQQNKLDVRKRNFLIEEAKLESEISELRFQANNQEATKAEREEAFTKAMELQGVLFSKRIALAKEELEIRKRSSDLSESDTQDLNEIAQMEAEIIRLTKQQTDQQKELYSQITGFRKAIKAEEEREEAERLDKARKEAEELLKIEREKDQAYQEYKAEFEQAEFERQLESEEEREAYRIELETEREADRIRRLQLSKERENELLLMLEEEKFARLAQLYQQDAEEQIKWRDLTEEQKHSLAKDGFNNASKILGEETKAGKAAAVAAATIDTYQGAQSAFNALAGIPIVGPALGGIAAAAAIVAGLSRISKMKSTNAPQRPKLAMGGWIGGNLHANGGTIIEAERGEFMVNRRTMSNPQMAAQIVQMNNAGNNGGNYTPLTEERVAQIAAQTATAIPVQVVEHDITSTQRKVQVRESKFEI